MNRARGIATAFICASFAITGALTGTLGQAQAQGEGKGSLADRIRALQSRASRIGQPS